MTLAVFVAWPFYILLAVGCVLGVAFGVFIWKVMDSEFKTRPKRESR